MQNDLIYKMTVAFGETLFMVFVSLILSIIFGLIIGLLLYLTSNSLFYKNPILNTIVGFIINVTRSIPFVILLILILPLSKFFVHTTIGMKAVIIPLAVAAIAFYARLTEMAFSTIDKGVITAAIASGAKNFQIIIGILIPEALPSLINGVTVTLISLIGYSAMAGTLGGGGVGYLAISYGYERYETGVMIACVVILVIFVQIVQIIGDKIANKFNKS